jgi:hypothetical protein
LDVAVRVHAGLVLDGLGQVAPEDVGDVLAAGLDQPDDDVDDRQGQELGVTVLDAEGLADDRVAAADDDVDGGADEELRHDVGQLVDDAEGDRGPGRAAVAAGVVPQADQRGPGVRGGAGLRHELGDLGVLGVLGALVGRWGVVGGGDRVRVGWGGGVPAATHGG